MSYSYQTTWGGGIILAPCLAALCEEIARHPRFSQLTNLGELGDTAHQAQGYSSDHNPFISHNGARYVRAIDLGGDRGLLLELRAFLFARYQAHDPRLYPWGYLKGPDSLITDWPPGTGWHNDPGDEGHLHVSVTQANGPSPTPAGWVPALDNRGPWGLLGQEADVTPEQLQGELEAFGQTMRIMLVNFGEALKTGQPHGWFDKENAPQIVDGHGLTTK